MSGFLLFYSWLMVNAIISGRLFTAGSHSAWLDHKSNTLVFFGWMILGTTTWVLFHFTLKKSDPVAGEIDHEQLRIPPWGWAILLISGFSVLLRTSVIERIQVSGSSMEPSLVNGQNIWIEKLSCGLRLPPGPLSIIQFSATGLLPQLPMNCYQRGDVVVYRMESSDGSDQNTIFAVDEFYIKRIIALPGDRYKFANDHIYINGNKLDESAYLTPNVKTEAHPELYQPPLLRIPETYQLVDLTISYSASFGIGSEGRVPPGSVLVLGDNRANSRDSRYTGFIPIFLIEGRMFFRE